MTLSAFICITRPEERGDTFEQCLASARGLCDEVVIVDGTDTWPQEFDWKIIGQHFQKGYERCTSSWVLHLDTDFIIHEKDFTALRENLEVYNDEPAFSMLKRQFILPDRFNLKSRLVVAVNKGKFGDRIRFDSGGDLCQPSIDHRYIQPGSVPDVTIPIWNYEKLIKTEAQIKDDVGRMARAWQAHFGEYKLGGPDDESAYKEWLKMVTGRFKKPQERVKLEDHPSYIQDTIKSLTPEQWGYSGFNLLGVNDYV